MAASKDINRKSWVCLCIPHLEDSVSQTERSNCISCTFTSRGRKDNISKDPSIIKKWRSLSTRNYDNIVNQLHSNIKLKVFKKKKKRKIRNEVISKQSLKMINWNLKEAWVGSLSSKVVNLQLNQYILMYPELSINTFLIKMLTFAIYMTKNPEICLEKNSFIRQISLRVTSRKQWEIILNSLDGFILP